MKKAAKLVLTATVVLVVTTIQSPMFATDGARAVATSYRVDTTQPMPPGSHPNRNGPVPPWSRLDGTQPMPPWSH
jgi:hypothetical protein